jgi:hypothetical protein
MELFFLILNSSYWRSIEEFVYNLRWSYFIFSNVCCTVISYDNTTSTITINVIFLYFRKTTTTDNDSWSLIFIYLVFWYVWRTIKHYDSIIIIIDLVVLYPTKSTFNYKNTFTSWWIYFIILNDCIRREISTKSDICFIISVNLILFNVSTSSFNQ